MMPRTTTNRDRTPDFLREDEAFMDFGDHIAGVIARDSRYTIEAYAFVLEALELRAIES